MHPITRCKKLSSGPQIIAGIPHIFENVRMGLRLHAIPFLSSDNFTKVDFFMAYSWILTPLNKTAEMCGIILINK